MNAKYQWKKLPRPELLELLLEHQIHDKNAESLLDTPVLTDIDTEIDPHDSILVKDGEYRWWIPASCIDPLELPETAALHATV